MIRTTLRQNIAAEAARLMVQRQANDWYAARRRAARQFSRRRVDPDELPTQAEIQQQVLALAGVYSEERGRSLLLDLRLAAAELLRTTGEVPGRVRGDVLRNRVEAGAEIAIQVVGGELNRLLERLRSLEVRYLHWEENEETLGRVRARVRGIARYPLTIEMLAEGELLEEGLDLVGLEQLIVEGTPSNFIPDQGAGEEIEYHPELRDHLAVLLKGLEKVRLDPRRHPEGDLLYHSLQVFELGKNERPYDEEFLLACLLHDVGFGLDRRHPQRVLMQELESALTERTLFFLEHHPEGKEYLSSGKIRPSLRKSNDFDDLILLARCDLDGRMCGAAVPTADEALDYIFGLEGAWENYSA
jgi:hypothetical protein